MASFNKDAILGAPLHLRGEATSPEKIFALQDTLPEDQREACLSAFTGKQKNFNILRFPVSQAKPVPSMAGRCYEEKKAASPVQEESWARPCF
jgi:hypothetical protein